MSTLNNMFDIFIIVARLLQRNTSMEHFQAIAQKQADAELVRINL